MGVREVSHADPSAANARSTDGRTTPSKRISSYIAAGGSGRSASRILLPVWKTLELRELRVAVWRGEDGRRPPNPIQAHPGAERRRGVLKPGFRACRARCLVARPPLGKEVAERFAATILRAAKAIPEPSLNSGAGWAVRPTDRDRERLGRPIGAESRQCYELPSSKQQHVISRCHQGSAALYRRQARAPPGASFPEPRKPNSAVPA
jgi:hypothetical protein